MSKSLSEFERGVVAAMPMLYSVAMKACHNPDTANDLVQEAVTRALANKHLFDGTNLPAWLVTILKNFHIANLRKAYNRLEDCDTDKLMIMQTPALSVDPVTTITAKEMLRMVNSMPEEYREPLLMRAVDGATEAEIALECVLQPGTVKSRLCRGRRMLTSTITESW